MNDADCAAHERCDLDVCVRVPGSASTETDGSSGTRSPTAAPARLATVVFSDGGIPVTSIVWRSSLELELRGYTDDGSLASGLVCTPSTTLRVPAPTVSDVDQELTAECFMPSAPTDVVAASLVLWPLAAIPAPNAPIFTPGERVDPAQVVATTADTLCAFTAGPPEERIGVHDITCARRGEQIHVADVPLLWRPVVDSLSYALAEDGSVVLEIAQRAADQCSVTCVETSTVRTDVNGSLVLPVVLPVQNSECHFECSNFVGITENSTFMVFAGYVRHVAQLVGLRNAEIIVGSIHFGFNGITGLIAGESPFGRLKIITRDLSFFAIDHELSSVLFPRLSHIGGSLVLGGISSLTSMDGVADTVRDFAFPVLSHIGDDLLIEQNPSLANVVLPRLTRVGGSLVIEDNPAVSRMELPELRHVGVQATDAMVSIARNGAEIDCDDDIRRIYCALEDPPALTTLMQGTDPCFSGGVPSCTAP